MENKNKFWSFNRQKDAHLITQETVLWMGPFSWNGFEAQNGLEKVPDIAGVYLGAFEYRDGYIVCWAGVTGSMKRRFAQHTTAFKNGHYTIIDVDAAKMGERREIWHGWGYAKNNRGEFEENKSAILEALDKQLIEYRIFIAAIEDLRKRERLEYAIMQSIYASQEPWSDLADRGMALKCRYNSEIPIRIKNIKNVNLYGLESILEI